MIISGQTKVAGIFGYPIGHTYSPKMHNAAFGQLGLDYIYLPFQVAPDKLGQAVESIRALNMAGVNITVPHKQKVIPFLDELTEEAGLLGAVNTILHKDGRLIGYNTDGRGFVSSLEADAGIDVCGKNILLIGAGGAAQALGISLATAGAGCISIANRTISKAKELADRLKRAYNGSDIHYLGLSGKHLSDVIGQADIIINCTSIGLKADDNPPISTDALHAGQLVCDLIYNPAKTKLLEQAQLKGASILNGLGMLIYQGAAAFEIWTGKKAPVDTMRHAIM